jgi:hypothetical protein
MKLGGERRDSFHGHETYPHCFQNFGNAVKPSLRRFIRFMAARLCPSAACSAATRQSATAAIPSERAPLARRGSDRASFAGRTRALPRGRRREAVATPSACRELKECKVRMARGGVNSLIKTSTRIT